MYLTTRHQPVPKYPQRSPEVLLGTPQVTSQVTSPPHTGDDSTAPCLASPPDETRRSQQESRLGIHRQGVEPMAMGHHIIYPLPPHRSFMGPRPGCVQGRGQGKSQGKRAGAAFVLTLGRAHCEVLSRPGLCGVQNLSRTQTLVEGKKKEKKSKGDGVVPHPSHPEKSQLRLIS
ncbi:hypothetical protein TARUN_10198 [Trichoderma arundinaceum]|uniref:Uncharacterized protein n=1 Tax=Trichoderma arundinaceum TaxID=490622 RepID=A0A395N860_TRIAR|nr:hypothetical protein TARUN_10198 [Trichoderma arundinaceum]